ncbi:DUF4178 domain-containing protein [Naumannella sp. ID2617S]|nr:DUF4178 domain-containing protein [Naumannella sp. ID2617S]
MTIPYLHPGAQFSYQGNPYTVAGTVWLNEDGDTWTEHKATGGPQPIWFTIEDDEVTRWTQRPDLASTLTPGARTVTADDGTFRLEESGTADYTAQGDTDTNPAGTVEYHDYSAPDGARLSFERFDGRGWEVATGRPVRPEEFGSLR